MAFSSNRWWTLNIIFSNANGQVSYCCCCRTTKNETLCGAIEMKDEVMGTWFGTRKMNHIQFINVVLLYRFWVTPTERHTSWTADLFYLNGNVRSKQMSNERFSVFLSVVYQKSVSRWKTSECKTRSSQYFCDFVGISFFLAIAAAASIQFALERRKKRKLNFRFVLSVVCWCFFSFFFSLRFCLQCFFFFSCFLSAFDLCLHNYCAAVCWHTETRLV